ncbi:uncharacterized protein BDW47DRAFT_93702 [Aspergillus candidus]|uniref:Uncharacterized protein n=1 Tax=Aspergillus candidus TaxID=41067 RepID=A0A2I2FI13_ASPCN|nr:hypothetical protein BDW47DRAFT_93702 [Aspergillus candidus]PLB40263.1 hypothetical protein BDW47DRAFT_93702 [Aspergillus candidus]
MAPVQHAGAIPDIPGEASIPHSDLTADDILLPDVNHLITFVLAAIWFFFWAKNGGFVWRKGDWEDYKSTVLRRKGPDGRTLSNATKSTRLGGGSVVGRGYTDDGYTVTDSAPGYTDTATTVTEKEPKRKRRFREAAKQKLLRRRPDDDHWEGSVDEDVRAYRQEKAARIGGINRDPDGTYHGSDYDTSQEPSSYQQSEMSQVRDYAYERPSGPPPTQTRNFSFVPGGDESEISQVPPPRAAREPSARRHNRRRERRSRPPSAVPSRQTSPRKHGDRRSVPGHYTEPLDMSSAPSRSEYQYSNVDTEDESGTRSYHHPIPGLSKGYRREGGRSRRRDSLSDSDGDETRYT